VEQLGRYEILEVLGRGAMGTVYRARDPKIDRIVAIKTITLSGITPQEKDEYRQRFLREAQAAGKLSHPNVVTVYDVGEEESGRGPYILMEYVEGRTLESLIGDAAGNPIQARLELVRQVAEALDYAHSQGVVHRDIKPANILVTPQGRAKVADFGIAKLAVTQLTMPGESPGTPSYMSPEQVTGASVDGRSDLFSLGIILYWILAGEKPFTGENAPAVTFKIAYQDPVPPTQLNPSLDARFDQVLARALAKDPAHRYQRGRDLADDLEDLGHGRTPRSQGGSPTGVDMERTVLQGPPEPLSNRVGRAARFSTRWPGTAAAFWTPLSRRARAIFGRVPWQVTLAVAAVSFAFFAFRSMGPTKTADLQLRCVHNFRAADLLVWVDEGLVYEGKLAGKVKKRLGLFKSVRGSFSDTLTLAPGKHVIRVQVLSREEGYDQTKEVEGELTGEGKRTLEIGFAGESKNLFLALH
jgi:serine/threonine protein kinase